MALYPSIHFVTEQIASQDMSDANLLIQSGAGFIGFSAFQPAEKKVYSWVLYKTDEAQSATLLKEKLQEMIAANIWIGAAYKKILLVQFGAGNVLVPAILNKDENKEILVNLVYGNRKNDHYEKDFVLQQNLVNHYTVEGTAAAVLNEQFPQGQWWHVQSLLLTRQAARETRLTATFWFNTVQITVEKNGNWLLLQTYDYRTPEDVLYYLLNTMQQLGLSQEETTVYLQGMIDQRSALYDVLFTYILNLQLKEELLFSYPAATEEQPVYLSASLDQVLTCV